MTTSTDHSISDLAFAASDLHKTFRLGRHTIPVLRGVNLEVRQGEWVALVGPSGCGKSTLLHLLGTLDKPTAWEMFSRGRPYSGMNRRQRVLFRRNEIGFVFQNFHLFPELSAIENVMLPALQWGWQRHAARTRALGLLERFGLADRTEHRPMELSGGEQQRVALARALINNPPFLLTDEPTGNLDAAAAGEIIAHLEALHRNDGRTLIMVTHDLALARKATRIWRLADGQAAPLPR